MLRRALLLLPLLLLACSHDGPRDEDVVRPPPVCTPSSTASYPATYPGGSALVVRTIAYAEGEDAWRHVGEDIDRSASPTCRTTRITSATEDGDGGIDNAFAHVLAPLIGLEIGNASDTISSRIAAGDRAPMFLFGGWPRGEDAKTIEMGFAYAEKSDAPPLWNGADTRRLVASADRSSAAFPAAFACGHELDSGIATSPIMIDLPIGSRATLHVPLQHAHARMTISPDGKTATKGVLSGVIGTEDLVRAFRDAAPTLDTPMCDDDSVNTIVDEIRSASDILTSGSQDPNRICNGVSFGIGFEAVAATPGDIAPPAAPPKNSCTR